MTSTLLLLLSATSITTPAFFSPLMNFECFLLHKPHIPKMIFDAYYGFEKDSELDSFSLRLKVYNSFDFKVNTVVVSLFK